MKYTYQDYELAKQLWIKNNPNATPTEYSKAMLAIAKKFGI